MDHELIFRVNATVTTLTPGFEVFDDKFTWNAYWAGTYQVSIDQLGHVPLFAPEILHSKEDAGLLDTVRTFASIHVRRDFINDYKSDLNKRLNKSVLVEGLITQRHRESRLGTYHGRSFPDIYQSLHDDVSPMAHLLKANVLCRISKDVLSMTIFINKPFIASWIRSLETAITALKTVEIGTRFRITGIDDAELSGKLERFLAGEATAGSAGYSIRGFGMGPPRS
jgi:hypothetical protein